VTEHSAVMETVVVVLVKGWWW